MITYPYTGRGFAAQEESPRAHDSALLLAMFRSMLRIRIVEEEIESRYHQDQMKTPIHLVIGQEGTAVGSCTALRREDLVYTSHRTHGVYLAKGGDLNAMLCEMHCRTNGCVGSRGGSMHLVDFAAGVAGGSAIVGGSVPIATGAALASKMQKLDRIVVSYLGEAATEEGAVSESLNFAALKRLPIVYFCENNFYSVQSPLSTRQPARELDKWAEAHGLRSVLVDGTNVLDVYDAMTDAVRGVRAGEGPVFIEARVYRFRAHGGAGDDSKTGYRDVAEREAWEKCCPLETFYAHLERRGLIDPAARSRMREEIVAETLEAFEFALASPQPGEAELRQHVYAD